ncbi:hypothetical protein LguiB_026391 [Lonicera macranthoides]
MYTMKSNATLLAGWKIVFTVTYELIFANFVSSLTYQLLLTLQAVNSLLKTC